MLGYSALMKKGFIFLCSDITEQECFDRSLFGGKEKYQGRVKGLEKGNYIFSYNYNTKKFHGVFTATTELSENIVSDAWKGEFPWQVKVKRMSTPKPLSREDITSDQYLREQIKFDRAGRPTARLAEETVEQLLALFKNTHRVVTYDDGLRCHCDDGHRVRSKAEQQIDNWLYHHGVLHAYETAIPGAKRCDFEIPRPGGSIYIEYWGMNTKAYLKDKQNKQKIYRDNNLSLIELEAKDLKQLDQILTKALL